MKEEELEEVLEALQSLLDALGRADMEFSEVPVLLEVIEEGRQKQAKHLLEGW